jgi:NAD(P)-dependent dehydrogenase (short-subunit alcohol dehydrogenase family)
VANDRFSVSGRVAVVTGSGSGLGQATARLFAERGADVVLAGRRPEPLGETAEDIAAIGRRALVVPTDVTDPEQCRSLVAAALTEFGRLDILVNNAGLGYSKPLDAWTATDWRDLLDVNLAGVWFLSMSAAQEMSTAGGGSIVNVSTAGSASAVPMEAPYIASKAAVDSITRSMAAAWTPLGVRVNAVAPAGISTVLHALEARKRGLADDAVLGSGNAMNRVADPVEIAHSVLFFASDASSYCSGQILVANGGPLGWGSPKPPERN